MPDINLYDPVTQIVIFVVVFAVIIAGAAVYGWFTRDRA